MECFLEGSRSSDMQDRLCACHWLREQEDGDEEVYKINNDAEQGRQRHDEKRRRRSLAF